MQKRLLRAWDGDIVRVSYALALKGASEQSSSPGPQLFEFMIGRGAVLPVFENAVVGMMEGETKKITVPPEKAYGPHNEQLVFVVSKSELPPGPDLKVGSILQIRTSEGEELEGLVIAADEDTVTIDQNHEFAGMELVFEINLLKIIRSG